MNGNKGRLSNISLMFACGTALFSDGYSNAVIGYVITLLTRIYGKEALDANNTSNTLSSLAFGGMILGMLVFGYITDKVGRKFGMMVSAGIIAFFAALSSASSGADGSFSGMIAMLGACRFLLGIGLGAEYPCGSVSASEQSEEPGADRSAQHRWLVLSTNTMLTFGFVMASFVPLVVYWICGDNHLRATWRISLGIGFFPALAVFIWRWRMEEPLMFQKEAMKRCKIPYVLIFRRYWKGLAAISAVWFIFDFITYPFQIYATTVINNVTGGATALSVVFGWGVIINLFSMPGTIGGAFVADWIGPKNTLIVGLVLQAIIGFIMSGVYVELTKHIAAFAVLYGVFQSLGELGPGNCTIILSSKTGPTAVRGQYYGVAAASGKVGAFIGTWTFPLIIDAFGGSDTIKGNTGPFWIGSGLVVLSSLITIFFVKPLSHDGMAQEDADFRAYLEENGYNTSQMGLFEGTSTGEVSRAYSQSSADKADLNA